jgi:hypothetical protein
MTRLPDDGGATPYALKRRDLLLAGGTSLLGVSLAGCAVQGQSASYSSGPLIAAAGPAPLAYVPPPQPAAKPTYVAQARDPVAYSIADNLFWNDILMEHALFFTMLMPGPQLAGPRGQAEEFQRLFARQVELSRTLDRGNVVAFNQASIDLARRFSDYKKQMQELQQTGRLGSLVWPLFFQHTAREADRFANRLSVYSSGQIEFDRAEVVEFWSVTMSEHAAFIAHLLDPQERQLIQQADQMEGVFAPGRTRGLPNAQVMVAARQILDFKTAGEQGIRAGQIKSIIPVELAAHVRREAERFIDELNRTVPTA